ncbi:MAG: SPASM domain-containing protein [Erysipelotrichaceae bacterium]|nr:SPASM domain-containing protein [Erysipelotrichaceae bacterium]
MVGECHVQNIIEANGNIYPCDFYCIDEYLMGNVLNDKINELDAHHFLTRDRHTNSLMHTL